MNTDTIEVFVEPGCVSCGRVIALLTSFANRRKLYLRILDRERDAEVFLKRRVLVCPATYLNNRLVFYGEFTEEALNKHVGL